VSDEEGERRVRGEERRAGPAGRGSRSRPKRNRATTQGRGNGGSRGEKVGRQLTVDRQYSPIRCRSWRMWGLTVGIACVLLDANPPPQSLDHARRCFARCLLSSARSSAVDARLLRYAGWCSPSLPADSQSDARSTQSSSGLSTGNPATRQYVPLALGPTSPRALALLDMLPL
jgi:hypothetical protein